MLVSLVPTGQDAFYLDKVLRDNQIKSVSVSRTGKGIRADVSDYAVVTELIKKTNPNYIFHLAANSTTSHEALFENHSTIATGTINILEAVKYYQPQARVFITGSGLQFKNSGLPISENSEFEANRNDDFCHFFKIDALANYSSNTSNPIY